MLIKKMPKMPIKMMPKMPTDKASAVEGVTNLKRRNRTGCRGRSDGVSSRKKLQRRFSNELAAKLLRTMHLFHKEITCASVRPLDRSVLNDLSTCASDSAHGAAWVSGVGQNISAAGTARAVSSTDRHAGWLAIAHTAAGRPPEGQTAT